MGSVREKEIQVEILAHMLDDAVRIPGTSLRFGFDPIVGFIPVVGDILTVISGSFILLAARQLRVPLKDLATMMYNQLLNGVVGAIPIVGDFFSFRFKSHAKNSAVLVRALRHAKGTSCRLNVLPLNLVDIGLISVLTAPVAVLAGLIGWWFWTRDYFLVSFLFD